MSGVQTTDSNCEMELRKGKGASRKQIANRYSSQMAESLVNTDSLWAQLRTAVEAEGASLVLVHR